jgi:hypothetical protein
MDFSDFLLPQTLETIKKQIIDSITLTEENYPFQREDEDAVSGSLGGTMRNYIKGKNGHNTWETNVYVIGGKGPNSPENTIGADGLIEVVICDENGRKLFAKGLPFQAKKEGSNSKLETQVQKMKDLNASSIVIDYNEEGFDAYTETDVLAAGGKLNKVPEHKVKSLKDMLTGPFLDCTIGKKGISYNRQTRTVIDYTNFTPAFYHVLPKRVIQTRIRPTTLDSVRLFKKIKKLRKP